MQVIGAGFGRTGTLSLKQALEELGFGPCYHMQEVGRRPSHVRLWLDYAETGNARWDELFESFESGVDYPVANVWAELADHYPDARVILTVRDPERWWESTNSTIYGFRTAFAPWFLAAVPYLDRFVDMVEKYVWEGLFDGRFTDRDHAISVFNDHADLVRSTCPSERLLEFEVRRAGNRCVRFSTFRFRTNRSLMSTTPLRHGAWLRPRTISPGHFRSWPLQEPPASPSRGSASRLSMPLQ